MAHGRTQQISAHRSTDGDSARVEEELVVEEPLEIHLAEELVATTMRTPGHDFELAVGFLWSEGLICGVPAEVAYGPGGSPASAEFNSVSVEPAGMAEGGPDPRRRAVASARLGLTSSSCGICGARQIEALTERLRPFEPTGTDGTGVTGAPDALSIPDVLSVTEGPLSGAQELFDLTGGSHAAAAVDGTGRIVVVREDIGRHNAVDKVVGRLVMDAVLPASAGPTVPAADAWTMWISGRASFEIIQKAWAGGFATVVAVGAVSSLAVHTARRAAMTLVGFSREGRATLYTGGPT